MARKNKKTRRKKHRRLSFRQICYSLNINPKDRVKMIRAYKEDLRR